MSKPFIDRKRKIRPPMNCIDAIEGTAKEALTGLVGLSTEYRMDATEYIRNAKPIIEGAVLFLEKNPEVSDSPNILRNVLCAYAKNLWLTHISKQMASDQSPDLEYESYCYDHIYDRGEYPR